NFTIPLPTYKYDPARTSDIPGVIYLTGTSQTFAYTLREVVGALSGVSYDSLTQYVVEVEVTYTLGNSTLSVVPTIRDAAGMNIVLVPVFSNTYTRAAGTASINGVKTLANRSPLDNEFTFQLLDSADAVVASGKNVGGIFTVQLPTYKYD